MYIFSIKGVARVTDSSQMVRQRPTDCNLSAGMRRELSPKRYTLHLRISKLIQFINQGVRFNGLVKQIWRHLDVLLTLPTARPLRHPPSPPHPCEDHQNLVSAKAQQQTDVQTVKVRSYPNRRCFLMFGLVCMNYCHLTYIGCLCLAS